LARRGGGDRRYERGKISPSGSHYNVATHFGTAGIPVWVDACATRRSEACSARLFGCQPEVLPFRQGLPAVDHDGGAGDI